MIRVDLAYIYDLSARFDTLRNLQAGGPLGEHWIDLYIGKYNLEELYTSSVFSAAFRASRGPAGNLLTELDSLLTRHENDPNAVLAFSDISLIHRHLEDVQTILRAELSSADGYLVTPLGAYDASTLLARPEAAWPSDLLAKVPSVLSDVQDAGKCLAFQLPTSAGFHILRIIESVLRKYWDAVSGGAAPPKVKTIGSYIAQMDKLSVGDNKVRASLNQIRDLHRNPLMHPEDSLTVEEAVILLGISVSVVAQMLRHI
nr:hypothetical protein [uncultured Hyphomonas sp.]